MIDSLTSHTGLASLVGFTVFGVTVLTQVEIILKIVLLLISITLGLITLWKHIRKDNNGN